MKVELIKTKEDECYEYYDRIVDGNFYCKTVKYKKDFWFLQPMETLLDSRNIKLDSKTCGALESVVDGDINSLYFIIYSANTESLKWVLGSMVTVMKERGYSRFTQVISALNLKYFSESIISGKIPKTFSKDIFQLLVDENQKPEIVYDLTIEEYEKYGYDEYYYLGVRKHPLHIIDDILKQDKFKVADSSITKEIVIKVLEENPKEVEKAKNDPKLINWLVGQCMKMGKGKLSAPEVKETIENIFNNQE